MRKILIALGVVVFLVVASFVWMYLATIRGSQTRTEEITTRIAPVVQAIESGKQPSPELIQQLAADPASRNLLLEALREAKREELFPPEFRTPEKIAESDLVFWLRHPHELDASPDEIEFVARMSRTVPDGSGEVVYFLFRFRTFEPHWAATKGWMAGAAGPYFEKQGVLEGSGGFSELATFDSQTPDQHVDQVHRAMTERNIFVVPVPRF